MLILVLVLTLILILIFVLVVVLILVFVLILVLIFILVLVLVLVLILILVLILVLVVVPAAAVLLLVFEHLLGVGQVFLGFPVTGIAPQGVLVGIDGALPVALFQEGIAHVVEGVRPVFPLRERIDGGFVITVGFAEVFLPEIGVSQIVVGRHGS